MADVTPAEEDLPLIISVDDHVMEPKTLWQEQLPASMRDRGPRVVQEKIRLEFTGGHYGFHRDDPDGQLCDVWLFEDSVTPTGFLHGPAACPVRSSATWPRCTRICGPAPTTSRRGSTT